VPALLTSHRDEPYHVTLTDNQSIATAAILLAGARYAAIRSGDRRGIWNLAAVAEDALLGVGGLLLLRRRAIGARQSSPV
jgi:hypothetical protein